MQHYAIMNMAILWINTNVTVYSDEQEEQGQVPELGNCGSVPLCSARAYGLAVRLRQAARPPAAVPASAASRGGRPFLAGVFHPTRRSTLERSTNE